MKKIEVKNIEVEIRSFISQQRYEELLGYFKENAKFVNEDDQETFYLDAGEDLRIQRSNNYSKIWLKKGKLHDEQREEIEVRFNKEDFEVLEKLFMVLGYNTSIKWFRKRIVFDWEGITVMMDDTKGYGCIIELEKMSSLEDQEETLRLLKEKLQKLDIPLTPKEDFDAKYKYYKDNWQRLVQ